jgi:hypothetical protein
MKTARYTHESNLSNDLSAQQPDQNISVDRGKTTASSQEARSGQDPNQKIIDTSGEGTASPQEAATVPRLKLSQKEGVNYLVLDGKDSKSLMKAMGADDLDFLQGTLKQLGDACSRDGVIDERQLNFMVSIIKGIKPRDQIEALLAAEMSAIHATMMKFAQHLSIAETTQEVDSFGNVISKLARTFATQMDALQRYRSGGEQKVTVQNVSVSEGGQAIVGNVTQTARSDDKAKDAASPAAITNAQTAPMPVIEERERVAVPIKRRAGKK